jgi:hypothetical protein
MRGGRRLARLPELRSAWTAADQRVQNLSSSQKRSSFLLEGFLFRPGL